MDTPDWRELIKDILVNPRTPIEDGKVLALKEGGGIKFRNRGTNADLIGEAQTNLDALEVLTLIFGESGKGIYIPPGNKYGDQTFEMMMAAIADYYGLKHSFMAMGQHRRDQYEQIRQRVYAQLDDKYGEDRSSVGLRSEHSGVWANNLYVGLKDAWIAAPLFGAIFGFMIGSIPGAMLGAVVLSILWFLSIPVARAAWWLDANMIRPINGRKWVPFTIASLIVGAVISPPLLYLARAIAAPEAKFPWEYDYEERYGKNRAYDNLGKTAADYAEIVRAFKAKHPQEFSRIAVDVRNKQGIPMEGPLFNINTTEAQRLLRADQNLIQAFAGTNNRAKSGWLTLDQAEAIILREAKKP